MLNFEDLLRVFWASGSAGVQNAFHQMRIPEWPGYSGKIVKQRRLARDSLICHVAHSLEVITSLCFVRRDHSAPSVLGSEYGWDLCVSVDLMPTNEDIWPEGSTAPTFTSHDSLRE